MTPLPSKWVAIKIAAFSGIMLALLIEAASTAARATKTGVVLALALGVSPLAVYYSIKRPLLFPFGLYVISIPFGFMQLPQFGTLSKLTGILAALAIAFFLLQKRPVLKLAPAQIAWTVLALWMAASGVWAVDVGSWWSLNSQFLNLYLLYVLLSIAPVDELDIRGVLTIVALTGLVAGAYGIYLFQHGSAPGRVWLQIDTGVTQDPNSFAASLLLPIALLITTALSAARRLHRLAGAAGVLISIGGVYVTGSRGALLAIAAIFAYFLWRSRHRVKLLLIAIAAALMSLPFAELLNQRLSNAISSGGAGRLDIWKVGFEAFTRHWLVGVGVGNFSAAYNESFISVYQRVLVGWNRGAHNLFVATGVELGIVGIALMLAAWIYQFRALRQIGAHHKLYDLRVAFEASVLGMFVVANFIDVMYFKYTWLTFGTMMLVRSLWLQHHSAEPSAVRRPASAVGRVVVTTRTAPQDLFAPD